MMTIVVEYYQSHYQNVHVVSMLMFYNTFIVKETLMIVYKLAKVTKRSMHKR